MSVTENDAKWSEFNILDYLDNDEALALYLEEVLQDDDPDYLIKALNNVMRARGINDLAKSMNVNRESLYKSLNGKTRPRWETIYKALRALGLQIRIEPANKTQTEY